MSEWKPGDVAMVTCSDGTERRAIYASYPGDSPCLWVFGDNTRRHASLSEARPLVVIDPEDADQVERLAKSMDDEFARRGWANDSGSPGPDVTDVVGQALREFARPTPRIEEPTGLGAVVEDEEGRRYVRHSMGDAAGTHEWCRDSVATTWKDVDAVRILSPGVEATS